MHSSTISKSSSQKRACDCCHKRKVRCVGSPCENCVVSRLTCTFSNVPQKKGPRGPRANVMSALRHAQLQCSIENQNRPKSHCVQQPHRSEGLVSEELIKSCFGYFFDRLYPTQPILHRHKVGETIGLMDTSDEAYCLVLSACAYILTRPDFVAPQEVLDSCSAHAQSVVHRDKCTVDVYALLEEVRRLRNTTECAEKPTIWSVTTSFLLYNSFFNLGKHNAAWLHLREAITFALFLKMDQETYYDLEDIEESTRSRCLYWLLYVTERSVILQKWISSWFYHCRKTELS